MKLMRKVVLLALTFTMIYLCNGQNIKKGSLLGLHILTIELKPDATMDEFINFYISRAIPETEKAFDGVKGYLVKAIRGENNKNIGVLWVFRSEADRNKYFNDAGEGGMTAAGRAAMDKLAGVNKEIERYGTASSKFTDWVVQ
jgi:hypothetical protein